LLTLVDDPPNLRVAHPSRKRSVFALKAATLLMKREGGGNQDETEAFGGQRWWPESIRLRTRYERRGF
jgi:hypothetical protein